MDFADVGDYFHIRALELGGTVHITARKSPRGASSFFVCVKSLIHSPMFAKCRKKFTHLLGTFQKKILLTMDLAVLSSCVAGAVL